MVLTLSMLFSLKPGKEALLTVASWEYPNGSGLECNLVSSDDSANFLTFLQALRADPVGQNLILSAAVGMKPFNGSDGNPMTDVSAFAKVFDHIGPYLFPNPANISFKKRTKKL